jgi:hypothetical protein
MVTKRPATNWAEIVSTAASRPIIRLKRAGNAGPFFESRTVAVVESDHRADERVAPSLDVCDVSVAKLAVTKCLADRRHVDPEASLLDRYVRPDLIPQFLLCDHLTRTLGKVDQEVQGPATKRQHHTLAPQYPLPS